MAEKKKETGFNINLEEMADFGLQFGHKKSKINPKMEPYLCGTKNDIHIIDLEKTKQKIEEVLKFIQGLISENKNLLIVGTKIQHTESIKKMATECGLPYADERWLGGTFTNFETIKKRIEYFKDLERKKREGELEKYTKKEKLKIDQELKELEKKFSGIKNLEKLPDAIFVVDLKKDIITVREAKKKGIKVIGISDSDCDPTLADYPIPANNDSISSVKYILDKIKEVILKAKPEIKKQ